MKNNEDSTIVDNHTKNYIFFVNDILSVITTYQNFSNQLSLRSLNQYCYINLVIRLALLNSVISKFTITEIKTSYHTHVKMQSGHRYSWGCNTGGVLGFTTETDCLSTPRRNKTLEQLNPDQHAIGKYHHVATKKNKLYS